MYILCAFVLTLVCNFVLALLVLLNNCDHISWRGKRDWAVIYDYGASFTFQCVLYRLRVTAIDTYLTFWKPCILLSIVVSLRARADGSVDVCLWIVCVSMLSSRCCAEKGIRISWSFHLLGVEICIIIWAMSYEKTNFLSYANNKGTDSELTARIFLIFKCNLIWAPWILRGISLQWASTNRII